MASVPRWVEQELEDVPFSEMRVMPDHLTGFDDNPYSEHWKQKIQERQLSQTSGCNPGLYTNYKKKAAPKAKPKGK